MAASGFAGLGYQVVWTQQSVAWLGHETASVLAIVAAFFGGLAVGALTLGSHIERSAAPGRWYAVCEGVIALWCLLLLALMAPAASGLLAITGAQPAPAWQWAVAFIGSFLLFLPATAAMGATLPAMARATTQFVGQGRSIAGLYAANTLGAVIGVLAAAFWLVPELGLQATAGVCVGLNLLCAAGAWHLFPPGSGQHGPVMPPPTGGRAMLTLLAFTGLLGIGYEVLVVRILSQVAENTVYTFALLLAVYLVGSAAGAAAYQRWLPPAADAARWRDRLLCAQSAACLLGTASLWQADALKAAVQTALGSGMAAALAAEAVVASLAFALPTVVMGALFSHLATHARESGVPLGRSLGFNTLGAALAPGLFGVLLVPWIGPKFALLAVAAGYLAGLSSPTWRRGPGVAAAWLPAGAVLGMAAWAPPLAFVQVPAGGRVVSYLEGAMGAVSVVEDADGVLRLHIDNRQQEGSSATLQVDARQAWLPVLLHPAPRRALFLGLGTGMTAGSAAQEPGLSVDAVELLPEVITASAWFTQALDGGQPNPRLHLLAADARRWVRASDRRYDVIVSDNFHPARSGSGALYTVEHFQAVQGRLAAGGLFCQWLPLHQLDRATLRSIVASFLAVYPEAHAIVASNSLLTPVIGLVGRVAPASVNLVASRQRLASHPLARPLQALGLNDEWALLGSFVAGPASLARFADGAALNTDDHPVVSYRAPRITYAPDSSPADRLLALLDEWSITPAELLPAEAMLVDAVGARRLAAYWAARRRFLQVGHGVRPTADAQRMLAQVGGPLLAVLALSADFRPAYDPLLRLAKAQARQAPASAAALLRTLQALQPARPEAALALRSLPDGPR